MRRDLIVSAALASIITKRGIEGAPDVAIEILSPSSRTWDRRGKSIGYAKFGVPEYWIVDPEDNWIDLFRLTEGAYALERHFEHTDRLSAGRAGSTRQTGW